jgi:hypothetical protein
MARYSFKYYNIHRFRFRTMLANFNFEGTNDKKNLVLILFMVLVLNFLPLHVALGGVIILRAQTNNGFVPPQDSSPSLPLQLSSNTPFAYDPQMVSSRTSDDVFIVWSGSTSGSGEADIYFSESRDGGKTFSPPKVLSALGETRAGTASSLGLQQEPRIAVSGHNVYVIWSDYSAGPAQLAFVKSSDNGTTFSMPISLGTVFAAAGETRLAASDNGVYAVWISSADDVNAGSILIRKSYDFGASFGATESISDMGVASMPELTTGEHNEIYLTWFNTTIREDGTVINNDILFSKSVGAGRNFSEPLNISESPNEFSVRPQIFVINSDKPIINNSGMALSSSSSVPVTPGILNETILNTTMSKTFKGTMGEPMNNDIVYLVWLESGQSGNIDIANIFFSKSIDGGESFTPPIGLSNNTLDVSQIEVDPIITASDDGQVFVVWNYPAASLPGNNGINSASQGHVDQPFSTFDSSTSANLDGHVNSEIFVAKSTNGGETFGSPFIISNSQGSSIDPSLLLLPDRNESFGSSAIVMWLDNSTDDSGLFDIFLTEDSDQIVSSSGNYNISDIYGNQVHVLTTQGSATSPQMGLVRHEEKGIINDTSQTSQGYGYSLIVSWSEYNSGYAGVFVSRIAL